MLKSEMPSFQPLSAACLLQRLREEVLPSLSGRVIISREEQAFRGEELARRTTVPFIKCLTAGALQLVDQAGVERTRLVSGDVCLFTADSAVNDRFPQPGCFLRMTIEAESLLIGFETVSAEDVGVHPQLSALTTHQPLTLWGYTVMQRLIENGTGYPASGPLFAVFLHEIIALLERDEPIETPAVARFHHVKHLMAEYAGSGADRSVIAQVSGLSPSYISKLFARFGDGQNFNQYMLSLRLERAKQYLRAAEWNMERIADRCGFGSANYFSQIFKQHVGHSPTAYRMRSLQARIK